MSFKIGFSVVVLFETIKSILEFIGLDYRLWIIEWILEIHTMDFQNPYYGFPKSIVWIGFTTELYI
jgi:hypothetical protein